jgi:hypothetical protein
MAWNNSVRWGTPGLIQDVRSRFRDSPERREAASAAQWLSEEEKVCGTDFATHERQQQAKLRDRYA